MNVLKWLDDNMSYDPTVAAFFGLVAWFALACLTLGVHNVMVGEGISAGKATGWVLLTVGAIVAGAIVCVAIIIVTGLVLLRVVDSAQSWTTDSGGEFR